MIKWGTIIMFENMDTGLLIAIIAIAAVVLIVGFVLLYVFVILPGSYKKQVKALEKRFSYLDAKLIGQDSQYIHRIEIISRTNLLYLEKYETFSRRFKSIFETEDKYSESMIKQLNSLIVNKQFKTIKSVIVEAKKGLDIFEESLNALDKDLYEVIQLEEDCRKRVDYLKEVYRHVKQTYYSESADLEMVAATFNKTFDKIDATFSRMDDLIESAEYEEINEKIPEMNNVLIALGKVLIELPTLCALVKTVVAEKISEIQTKYKETEKQGVPLYHLGFKNHVEDWKKRLSDLTKRIINLQCSGVHTECDLIIAEINRVSSELDDEIKARTFFKDNYEEVYHQVNEVQKTFLKISSMLPQIEQIYLIGPEQKAKIEELSTAVTNLGNSKRYLDGFVLSGTRQPFSLLKKQLDELRNNYEVVYSGVEEFKNYLDSLKTTAEEAYKMIYVYYYRVKQIEQVLADIGIDTLTLSYKEKIDAVYDVLNYIYEKIQTRPIDVIEVTSKIDQLKNISNALFDEIDSKSKHSALTENAVIKLNALRAEQDVSQTLEQIEVAFYKGEFESTYDQALSVLNSRASARNE